MCPSANGNVPWGAGCSAYVSQGASPVGTSVNVTNTAGGYQGSVGFVCDSTGTWQVSSQSCAPQPPVYTTPSGCAAQVVQKEDPGNPGFWCTWNIPSLSSGGTYNGALYGSGGSGGSAVWADSKVKCNTLGFNE
jgi:hypothetical protein